MDAYTLAITIYSHPLVKGVLLLLAANIVVGIASAFYHKDFRLGEMADWLMSRAIPYIVGAGAMQLVVMSLPGEMSGVSQAAGWAVWMFVIASMIGHVLGTLAGMGMPVPTALGDREKAKVEIGT